MVVDLPAPLGPISAKIEPASTQAAEFCRQLLTYSGNGRFNPTQIELNGLITQTNEILRSSVHRKINLHLDFAPAPLLIDADPAQVQQVVMNLVINGGEAIGDNTGTITLYTDANQTAWTNSGTKTLYSTEFLYRL